VSSELNLRLLRLCLHCVQTDPAKNVWTRAYLIPERNRTVRRQEEGKNYVDLFVFCMNLGEINALLTISFLYCTLNEMKTRFTDLHVHARIALGLQLVPSIIENFAP
jgi:hypothetical protein